MCFFFFFYTCRIVSSYFIRCINTAHTLPYTGNSQSAFGHSFLIWINYPISTETVFLIQHNVPAICQRCIMRSPLHYSCTLLSGWLNASFLYSLRLIWNSNIASLLGLNNIDFHLLSRGSGNIFRTRLCFFLCMYASGAFLDCKQMLLEVVSFVWLEGQWKTPDWFKICKPLTFKMK